ncbi:MAG: hypothetical protein KDC01_01735 [Flavobacteriales bacterium]|jgi:hypothetical protein|nr:hypothetical protein [Flavobacteriales bacterium]
MTETQVLQAAMRDLPTVERKMQRAKELLRRKHMKGDRKAVLVELHDYKSPQANHWMVVMRHCKAGIQVFHYAWYRGMDKRMRAIHVRPDGNTAFHFSKHVFDRYSERFSPDVSAEDRLRQFFLENHMYSSHTVDLMAETIEDIVSVNQGWLFGYRDEEENLTILTTFVDHGRFFENQHKLEQKLERDRLMAGMSLGQRMEFLRKLKDSDGADELGQVGNGY